MSAAEQYARDAETLRAAAKVMRIYFGGLEGTIASLDAKARQLDFWSAEVGLEPEEVTR